ncbi:MAG TPA: EpsG family protein [Burkholderiaceae bacterium]|nr:EpsG family protein [Burkholderiaceae bacterium]
MVIYFVPFVAFFLLALCSPVVPRLPMRLMVLIVVVACIGFAGFRYESDFDFNSYVLIFDSIPPLTQGWEAFSRATENLYLEPSFAVMVALVKIAFPELWIFLLIATASLLLYYRSFNRVATYPAVAFLIYLGDGYYLREFTQIRFGLAVSLGFAGMVALYEGRVWVQRKFIVIACLFHFTAVMLLATQLWTKYIRNRKSVIFVSTLLFVMALSGVFDGLIQAVAGVNLAPQRILDYMDTENAENVSTITLIGSYVILLWMTHVFRSEEREFFWVSIYAFSFAFLCLFSGFDLMRRVSFYFSVALYVVASQAMRRRRIDFVTMTIVFSALLFSARLKILYDYQNWLLL